MFGYFFIILGDDSVDNEIFDVSFTFLSYGEIYAIIPTTRTYM